MPDEEIHQPNDKLFSTTFSIPENTAGLLSAKLPPALAEAVNWSELRLLPGSFVDSQFRRSHTDLLYSAPIGDREGLRYLLFEHLSSQDRMLPLRLLRYMTRIWERAEKSDSSDSRLPFILPAVLSQNAEVWNVSPQFAPCSMCLKPSQPNSDHTFRIFLSPPPARTEIVIVACFTIRAVAIVLSAYLRERKLRVVVTMHDGTSITAGNYLVEKIERLLRVSSEDGGNDIYIKDTEENDQNAQQ